MKVLLAEVMGMCFGVRAALRALDRINDPEDVTIHGELVHNEAVLTELGMRGFRMVDEADRQDRHDTDSVLITAHGISDVERQRLRKTGKHLIDTTCPLVLRVHRAARTLHADGFHVLVIGKRGHVEVQGVVEDLRSYDVIQSPDEVKWYPHNRLGIICQSTATTRNVQLIRAAVERFNQHAEIRFIDTVCRATKEHQLALERLIDQVDVMVVIGGQNSNNTRELVKRCRERGLVAYHVQSATDLQTEWFSGCDTVGLTAGTSTLDVTIREVHEALVEMGHVLAEERQVLSAEC